MRQFWARRRAFFCCVREWPELLLTIQVVAVLPFLVRAISFACRPVWNHLLWTVLSQRENRYDPPLLLCAITLINTPVGGWFLFHLHSTRALVLETESEDAGNALRMNVIWFKAEQSRLGWGRLFSGWSRDHSTQATVNHQPWIARDHFQ